MVFYLLTPAASGGYSYINLYPPSSRGRSCAQRRSEGIWLVNRLDWQQRVPRLCQRFASSSLASLGM